MDYLRKLKNAEIILNILRTKLIALLALATGEHLQTLAYSIEINSIHQTEVKIDIPIPKRMKTSARNKFQPLLGLPFLDSDPEIGVTSTLLFSKKKQSLL